MASKTAAAMSNRIGRLLGRGCLLSIALLFVLLLMWLSYCAIDNGISADLMGFESEPAQGWSYWRWVFIKRRFGEIFSNIGILGMLFGVVLWRWIVYVRDIVGGRYSK